MEYIDKAGALKLLETRECGIRQTESIGGSGRVGYKTVFHYYLVELKFKDGKEVNRGYIRGNIARQLIAVCDKHRSVVNKASGTGQGWYYWIGKKE